MVATHPTDGDGPPADWSRVVDPDVDLHSPAQRAETRPRHWDLLAAIALGGAIGAEARWGLGLLFPHHAGQFPLATVLINASGSFLIGVVMVIIVELTRPHRLVRPFVAVGILGGYTTFSTFAVDVEQLILADRAAIALLYVVITVIACAGCVWAATILTRRTAQSVERRRARNRRRRAS